MRQKPLEIFAATALHLADKSLAQHNAQGADTILKAAGDAMAAYDEFLAILADADKRSQIENLREDDFETDSGFLEAKHIGDRFRDAIASFFFDADDVLAKLIRHYGVF